MPYPNPDSTILDAKHLVESDKRSEIRLHANGGNSILIVCPPEMELEYIGAIERLLPVDNFRIIDLNSLLIRFVDENKEDLDEMFSLLQKSINQIFKLPEQEEGNDLYSLIIKTITESYADGKVPVLINIGALYGSGIDNIHIMENQSVMKGALPLILLYPATKERDKLMFLGRRPASKYRCMIIE